VPLDKAAKWREGLLERDSMIALKLVARVHGAVRQPLLDLAYWFLSFRM
jgi:hypothetical protein